MLSGPAWCDQFPTSHSLDDLNPAWRPNAKAYVGALQAGGISVPMGATLRPRRRGYCMHWSWMIAREGFDPAHVPTYPGVDIQWLHLTADGKPDLAASKTAAEAMVLKYDIAYEPSLTSRHYDGLAIDISPSWRGVVHVKDARGVDHAVTWHAGEDHPDRDLWPIAASYGVNKHPKDRPHYSSDGR